MKEVGWQLITFIYSYYAARKITSLVINIIIVAVNVYINLFLFISTA